MEEGDKEAALTQFSSRLIPWFQSKGFVYRRAEESFVRVEGDMSWKVGPGLSLYPDRFEIRPMACVRHEQVERIFHTVSDAPEQIQKASATVLWSWAVEKRTPKPNSFIVERSSQVLSAGTFTQHFFKKWVEPFFQEHSNLNLISESFNDSRAILRAKHFVDWFDLLGRALITARLTERADYEILKDEYRRNFAAGQSSHPLSSFDALIRILGEGPPWT